MIRKIKLKFNEKGKDGQLEVALGPVTIFVGPNNAGKSLLLREIDSFCQSGKSGAHLLVDELDLADIGDDQIGQSLDKLKLPLSVGEHLQPGHVRYGKFNSTRGLMQFTVLPTNLTSWKNSPNKANFLSHFVSMFTSRFGGKERFNLIADQAFSDLQKPPNSNLMAMFQDNAKRLKAREIIHEAFQKFFVVDPTGMSTLRIRLSDVTPPSTEVEKGWDAPSVEFHKKAKHISEFSDGVQAFTGIVMATLVGDEKILLLDEPEAFLHPALSNLLGRKLSEIMHGRDGNLIVATHSPNFVMGCLQSGRPITIVRLTFDGEIPTARTLSSERIAQLFRHPLLRSTGVIQALFYSGVIVTEADSDRAFYNEINERLLQFEPTRGVPSAFFVNAQNKQTVWDIVGPLREMGIPAAAIVDIDVIKDGGAEFTKLLKAAGVPEPLHSGWSDLRSKSKEFFNVARKDMKRDGGVGALSGAEKAALEQLLSDLGEYGVFVVPGGELESWLKPLGATGHGPAWLISIFEKMGSDPNASGYLKPNADDVWRFMEGIRKWIVNKSRKGLS